MAYAFGSLVFTPVIKALQERYGRRRQYARREDYGAPETIGEMETDFLAEADSFFIGTVGATGWPYVQHRGGPKGFLKVIDDHTVAFADFQGNKQFVSTGNLATDDRVALILVDYPSRTRLKILGHVKIFEGVEAQPWMEKLTDPHYKATIERVFMIRVAAFDWNCQQHIKPRFTEEQIRVVLRPLEKQMQQLKEENERLGAELIRLTAKEPVS
jgi:hypothetical protein